MNFGRESDSLVGPVKNEFVSLGPVKNDLRPVDLLFGAGG